MPRRLGPADQGVADLACKLRLATRSQIDDALLRVPEQEGKDLAEILFALGVITMDQAQGLREVAAALAARIPDGPDGAAQTAPLDAAARRWIEGPDELPSARYTLKEEIGRGGLGRVVEAIDHVFNRTVALKLLVEGADPLTMDRFRFEGQITGRLDHPHIVAVHDMGVLVSSHDAFFAMKRIHGQDLAKIISRRLWPQRRLIEAFRDICLAIAYAHSRGVVHRDLKPANVMLGEFGEVFVVDWGLARSMHFETAGEAKSSLPFANDPETSRLTLAGSIIGTPQYMSPEQALGRIDAIDEKSDVYGLGAILYQILCGRPPFEAENYRVVLKRVVSERPAAPSVFAAVDPQLEAICLKALEKDPKARHASARVLANEIDAHLEGVRDLEHRSEIARRHLEDAKRLTEEWKAIREEWRSVRSERERSRESLGVQGALEALRASWQLEDKLEALARRGLELFHEADIKIGSALSVVPGHVEARRMRATHYWEKFLLAEEEGDDRGLLGARRVLEAVDDGTYTAQIRGEGTLSVETFAYRCSCLVEGRRIAEGEFLVGGHDPWTGKRPRAETSERERRAAHAGHPRFLKIHGAGCHRIAVPGAEVWLYRNLEADRVLVPVGEGVGGPDVPEIAVRRLYGDSSFRPRGAGQFLGKTPIRDLRVPMGSGILIVVAPGRDPVVVPWNVGRGESVEIGMAVFSPGENPDSARLVTSPPRRSGALRPAPRPAEETRNDGEFFVERYPVTCREYAEFLNALAAISPREALKRVPRGAETSDFYWPEDSQGRYSVPCDPEQTGGAAGRDGWREDWPVIGVSWEDAMAFARWKSEKSGRLWSLLPEALWQQTSQGEDRRPFPWGERRIAWFSHNLESAQGRHHPEPVGSRPFDESPFGVRDMAGNVSEWCLDELAEAGAALKLARGGNWSASHLGVDCTTRLVGRPDLVHLTIGFRLCSPVLLSGAKQRPVAFGV